jgi:hypothetical protein
MLRYIIHNKRPPVPALSQINPNHSPKIFNIHVNIIPSFISMSSKWSLPFKFSDQNYVRISHIFHSCYMSRPSHSHRLLCPNNIRWTNYTVQTTELLVIQLFPPSFGFILLGSKYSQTSPIYVLLVILKTNSDINVPFGTEVCVRRIWGNVKEIWLARVPYRGARPIPQPVFAFNFRIITGRDLLGNWLHIFMI